MRKFFDKEKVLDEEISPLIDKLVDICRKHEIPMACQFEYAYLQNDGSLLSTTVQTHGSEQIKVVSIMMLHQKEILAGADAILKGMTMLSDKKDVPN